MSAQSDKQASMNKQTLSTFLAAQPPAPQAEAMQSLLLHVADAAIEIARLVNSGPIQGVTQKLASTNIQGETQMQLDVLSHEEFEAAMRRSAVVAGLLSEEVDDAIDFVKPNTPFLVSVDPLDGSSNIAINGVVGTIFSVLPASQQALKPNDFLQAGTQQIAAGYVMYGPATQLVITLGHGAHAFTLDEACGQFVLTQADLRIPNQTTDYAINASNQRYWQPAVQRYVSECMLGAEGPRGQDFNMRWCGSMVADVHRILMRGGVFMYPRDTKQPIKAGRLRLLYEANPMSWLVMQAGGLSIDGEVSILDIVPEQLHQRVPVLLGSADEIQRLLAYHQA